MRLMRESKNPTIKKLRSKVGESIAETLVALLVAALALTMLAGAISASSGIVNKSRTTLDRYYTKNETTVVGMSNVDHTASVSLKAVSGGSTEQSYLSTERSYTVNCFVNDTFAKSPVIAYKIKKD